MDERRKKQIESDISGLKSDISRAKEDIRGRVSMMDGAPPKQAEEHQKVIRNLENFIKATEQRIDELKRELK
jgi:hypothetical protein